MQANHRHIKQTGTHRLTSAELLGSGLKSSWCLRIVATHHSDEHLLGKIAEIRCQKA